jgi:integrase
VRLIEMRSDLVMRLVILAAATSGLRQSELLGLRWKHVDLRAQRIRIRNAWVRLAGERVLVRANGASRCARDAIDGA